MKYTESEMAPRATTRELNEMGINGRGERVFTVFTTVTETGLPARFGMEKFATKAEAEAWIKWA